MSIDDMAILLAKVQLGDNRTVDDLVIVYWQDTIGDLDFDTAMAALKRYRRERPGQYLEPGHLLELAGVVDEESVKSPIAFDFTLDFVRHQVRAALDVLRLTEADYDTSQSVRDRVQQFLTPPEIEEGR